MSTFDGYVAEFPLIRIDYFRPLPGKAPPFACFLSHVHSDHLAGLESLKSPFVYCSSATRELLLRLEKYSHRVNLAKGILDSRIQSYRHLHKLLKPLPLDTPTTVELCPGNEIQVTLFDANHCLGAVMFLIEGNGNAILYTGDIRSEPWWIRNVTQNPILLPYTIGLRRLNKIYLDTTFAVKSEPYREFQSKAEGIQELLRKVSAYPSEAIFYFRSWTFGYEDVWLALSHFLNSQIHLDRYRYELYSSVGADRGFEFKTRQVPALAGFYCGNVRHDAIITRNANVRIHSCENPSTCALLSSDQNVVDITPIVSRHNGIELRELGAGGGKGDLNQIPELDIRDPSTLAHLMDLCNGQQRTSLLPAGTVEAIKAEISSGSSRLELPRAVLSTDEIKLRHLPSVIARIGDRELVPDKTGKGFAVDSNQTGQSHRYLANSITFPYSRHSSYTELRALVEVFKPVEVWPCTITPAEEWKEEMSMTVLFGDLCDNPTRNFASDKIMRAKREQTLGSTSLKRKRHDEQETQSDDEEGSEEGSADVTSGFLEVKDNALRDYNDPEDTTDDSNDGDGAQAGRKTEKETDGKGEMPSTSQQARLQFRMDAFRAASTGTWQDISLVSVRSEDSDHEL